MLVRYGASASPPWDFPPKAGNDLSMCFDASRMYSTRRPGREKARTSVRNTGRVAQLIHAAK